MSNLSQLKNKLEVAKALLGHAFDKVEESLKVVEELDNKKALQELTVWAQEAKKIEEDKKFQKWCETMENEHELEKREVR